MMKVAILIDGGYFLKRLPGVQPAIDRLNAEAVVQALGRLIVSHLEHLHRRHGGPSPQALLYRTFYYDAEPYQKRGHRAVSGRAIDYAKSEEALFRLALFERLRRHPNLAVRLGRVERERAWVLRETMQKDLIAGRTAAADLTDDDFAPGFRQKSVDMKLGLDIASLTLKKHVDTIILVTGDSDFVPAAKLARREGVRVILDPLWQDVKAELFEHIDGLRSGFPRPVRNRPEDADG